MIEIFNLFFAWLPLGLQYLFKAVVILFILAVFIGVVCKIIELLPFH